MKGYESEIWYKISGRKLRKVCFVENSHFSRGSAEAAVRGCFCINSKGNTRGGPLI